MSKNPRRKSEREREKKKRGGGGEDGEGENENHKKMCVVFCVVFFSPFFCWPFFVCVCGSELHTTGEKERDF